MTEQIGARRRELYAKDIFVPADEDIGWEYKNPSTTFKSLSFGGSRSTPSEALPLSQLAPIKSESSPVVGESVFPDMYERTCRMMDYYVSQVDAGGSATVLANIYSEVTKLSALYRASDHTGSLTLEGGSFMDTYLGLFQRLGVSRAIAKLEGSGRLPHLELISLRFAYETLVVPLGSDISILRRRINEVDWTKEPSSTLVELLRLGVFLQHPLMEQLLESLPCGESATLENGNPATKSQLREMKNKFFGNVHPALVEALRESKWTESTVQRLHLLREHAETGPMREHMESVLAPHKNLVEKYHKLNLEFRQSLFPTHSFIA